MAGHSWSQTSWGCAWAWCPSHHHSSQGHLVCGFSLATTKKGPQHPAKGGGGHLPPGPRHGGCHPSQSRALGGPGRGLLGSGQARKHPSVPLFCSWHKLLLSFQRIFNKMIPSTCTRLAVGSDLAVTRKHCWEGGRPPCRSRPSAAPWHPRPGIPEPWGLHGIGAGSNPRAPRSVCTSPALRDRCLAL